MRGEKSGGWIEPEVGRPRDAECAKKPESQPTTVCRRRSGRGPALAGRRPHRGALLIAGVFTVWTQGVFTIGDLLVTAAVVSVPAAGAALILGSPLTVVAHYRLRRVQSRWHVALFALLGALVAALVIGLVFARIWAAGIVALLIASAALASAVGRLSVRSHQRSTMPAE